jgi:CO dehydrogenase maturation factor
MSYRIAVAGKGGVGKTTVSALLIMALHERTGKVVMAVDADPNSNLGEKLGIRVERTIGELREDLLRNVDSLPPGQSKQEYIEYQMRLATVEGEGFDLLSMGRPEGPGCYCYINNILRTFLDLAMDRYDYVVIDNEAGMEHLSRRTTMKMDVLAIVTDYTRVGMETAGRLLELAREMKVSIGSTALVVNMMPEADNPLLEHLIGESRFDEVVRIPRSEEVARRAVEDGSLSDLPISDPAYQAVQRLTQ